MKAQTAAAFSPTSVTSANLFLWHRADSFTPGATTSWDDKSGNGRAPTQGTAANQPATGGATINGQPTINFDPSVTVRYLQYATNVFNGLTAAEVFIIRRANADAVTTGNWAIGGSGSADFAPFSDRGLYDDFGSNTRTAAGAPAVGAWAQPHCLNVIATAAEWTANFNFAVLFPSAGANTVAWNANAKLGTEPGASTGFAGQIAEVIIYDGKLSTVDRNALANTAGTSYLRSRYGF